MIYRDQPLKGFPKRLIGGTIALCVLPLFLSFSGVKFETSVSTGAMLHAMLEWTAVVVAILTVALVFSLGQIRRDLALMVLALSLFWSAGVNAVHALSGIGLDLGVSDNQGFLVVSGIATRFCHTLILISGAAIILLKKRTRKLPVKFWHFLLVCSLPGIVVLALCWLSISSNSALTFLLYQDRLRSSGEPFLLALNLGVALPLLYQLHLKLKSLFSQSMLISIFPHALAGAIMLIGPHQDYGFHFYWAHFSKILACLVPFCGVCLEYCRLYLRSEALAREGYLDAEALLKKRALSSVKPHEDKKVA